MGTRREVNDRFPSISQHSDLCARSQTACHPLIHFVEQCSQRHTSLRLSSFRGRIRISSTFQSQQCIQCFHPAHTLIVYFDTLAYFDLLNIITQLFVDCQRIACEIRFGNWPSRYLSQWQLCSGQWNFHRPWPLGHVLRILPTLFKILKNLPLCNQQVLKSFSKVFPNLKVL